mmetsp:Transcript_55756/g.155239  ORF Transcript_55756/g.155239 Transcript_55756/m.155239 type:complete len:300 (+) Transcript_55756:72-971(+)
MALKAMCSAALVAVGAMAQQDGTILLQSSVSTVDELAPMRSDEVAVDFKEGSFGLLPENAPTWCKDESQLTWKQRKERMQQHITLEWAKKAVKDMLEKNETVPEWMDKLVADDEKRGKMKWAVGEVRRLRAEGQEVPQWLSDLEAEDARWANRWAACKGAELRAAGGDVPLWMVENGRKGIMEAAKEKTEELQEELDELEEQKEEEAALVGAQGDVTVASQKLLARSRKLSSTTLAQQTHVLEVALEELDMAEGQLRRDSTEAGEAKKVKQALWKAKAASSLLRDILDSKASLLKTGAA